MTPTENQQEILDLLSNVKSTIFSVRKPSLRSIIEKLAELGVEIPEAENWDQGFLLDMIVYAFGVSDLVKVRKSLQELQESAEEIAKHLPDCDLSKTLDITFTQSRRQLREGQDLNPILLENAKNLLNRPKSVKAEDGQKLIENLQNKPTVKNNSFANLINLFTLHPALSDKISAIRTLIGEINFDSLERLESNISEQNQYHSLLTQIQETSEALLKDYFDAWIAELKKKNILNEEFTNEQINKLKQSIKNNLKVFFSSPIQSELKNFEVVENGDKTATYRTCCEKILSLFLLKLEQVFVRLRIQSLGLSWKTIFISIL